MNTKKNIADKILAIRIPEVMFSQFKERCDDNCKTMSDTIRDFIREYLKSGGK
jgi:metal-responsive CopG/Arc/MetJ family transcriptional regulator